MYVTFPVICDSHHDSHTVPLKHDLVLILKKIEEVRKTSPSFNYHHVSSGSFSISHPFYPRGDTLCTGPIMLSSANFTAYDSLSCLPLITLRKVLIIFFHVSGLTPTHSQLRRIASVFSCRTVVSPSKTSRHQHSIRSERFVILSDL